jgi:hypothetical protein
MKSAAVETYGLLEPFRYVPRTAKKKVVEGFLGQELDLGYSSDGVSPMPELRRIIHSETLHERLAHEAKRLRAEAKKLKPGAEREALLRLARQAEIGSHMSEWLSSPGLQPPR